MGKVMAGNEKQRRIRQISAIAAPDGSPSDLGLVALDEDGQAWILWYGSSGKTTDWEPLPALPPKL
jgi:hypothetical protein